MLFPRESLRALGLEPISYLELWQLAGMLVGVYGVAYALAARDPLRHWPIVFVGLLGKVLGPIGFVLAASDDRLPWRFGLTILANDVVWWIPFAAILVAARRRRS